MHDPMRLLDDPESTPNPWESLAVQARALAALADRYAARTAEALAPIPDDDDYYGDYDPLADLDARARALVGIAAACRRHTWQSLVDAGQTQAQIGRMWNVRRSTVNNALNNPNRKR